MSPATMESTQAKPRLTKPERSARTKKLLLEATLESLAENGYTGTSTTDVVKRAGLSRGALAHHYPSKAQLVAEAAAFLIRRRIEDSARLQQEADPEEDSIEQWVRIQWEAYEKWFPANIEFMVAARTDSVLKSRFSEAIKEFSEGAKKLQVDAGPDLSAAPDPVLTNYVIGCFIRGLCLERIVNPDPLVDQIFSEFIRILEIALAPD